MTGLSLRFIREYDIAADQWPSPVEIRSMYQARLQAWIDRLNWLAVHRFEREERRAECVLLGHQPSGERFMTTQPIHVCWWCAYEFQMDSTASVHDLARQSLLYQ